MDFELSAFRHTIFDLGWAQEAQNVCREINIYSLS